MTLQRFHTMGPAALALSLLLPRPALAAGPVVALNQAGYASAAPKVAVTPANADSFRVIDAATGQVAWRGATALVTSSDPASGLKLWKADFSPLQKPGEYLLVLSSGDSSQHFPIADSVYAPVYRAALKGFYYQRCGMALEPAFAGPWSHPRCHVDDARFHRTAEGKGSIDATGGWHDAGDFGKYTVNAGISVATLLAAYEWFPARFAADDLNIPESGNGIPDILDETRYELTWLLKMQAPDGGVYHKITDTTFEGFIMPPGHWTRYIYQEVSTGAADFVAMMARASRVYRPFDAGFANTCLAAAGKAWRFLESHPTIVPPGGFKNPPGTVTGTYSDRDDADERLWAAAELFLANGDASAKAFFLAGYASSGIITNTQTWSSVKTMAELTYLMGKRSGIDASAQDKIRASLLTYAGSLLSLHDRNGFGCALELDDYIWGSNAIALNNAILLLVAAEQGGGASFAQAALDQLHYVLGRNAHGLSFLTGIGARRTMHPHHRPSGADEVVEPVPGLLAGGPDHDIWQDPVLKVHFTRSTPPALCYIDDQGSYASNEICINWNAPLVLVAGYFMAHQQ